jgi:PRD1 phage membrane DNA delivery
MDKFGETVTGIIASIITVAIIALVISNGSTTVGVLTSFFQGLTGLLGVAISPVTGQTSQFANTGLQSSGLFQTSLGGVSSGINSGGVNIGGTLTGLGNLASSINGISGSSGGTWDSGTNSVLVNSGEGFVDSNASTF